MRILVDTSVWSLSLRKGGPADHPAVERLNQYLASGENLFLTGVILQEILQAYRSERTAENVAGYLDPFPLLEIDRAGIKAAARLFRQCRSKGIAVSTIDSHIAAAAIGHSCALLTADRDFERVATVSELQLA